VAVVVGGVLIVGTLAVPRLFEHRKSEGLPVSAHAPSPAPAPAAPTASPDPAPSTDGIRAAFASYRRAIRAGDIDALRSALVDEKVAELDQLPTAQLFDVIRAMVPEREDVLDVQVRGDEATLTLSGESSGQQQRGEVAMRREGGTWKLLEENWKVGGAAATAPAQATQAADTADGAWSLSIAGQEPPSTPAGGRVYGRSFSVADAEIRNGILTLTDGDAFDWQGKILVFLFPSEGDKNALDGTTVSIGPKTDWDAPFSAHVHMHAKKADKGFWTDAQTDGFALELRFGQRKDGRLPVRIRLSYPDAAKSWVAGAFEARLVD
jgi:ketosteroid isomerase-like protein